MKKKTSKNVVWVTVTLAMICLCLTTIGLGLYYFFNLGQSSANQPIVWITIPTNHQVFTAGDSVSVQAYVRSKEPISHLELWIDSHLVKNMGVDLPPTGLSYVWQGAEAGTHSLVARAVTAKGASSQATVLVEFVGQSPEGFSYTVQEGDTIDSIAEEVGQPVESLQASNPETIADGVSAGEELTIPGGDPGDEAIPSEEPPASDEPAPDVLPDPATSGFPGSLFFFMQQFDAAGNSEQIPLRIELLDLVTMGQYESLHCYIGATGSLPRWYPDSDNDQATDESFEFTPGWGWNISDYYAGNHAPVIMWPGNENLALDISCTGVENGGTEAIQAGHLSLSIPSDNWDGVATWATSEQQEDYFLLHYLVSHTTPDGRGIPVLLDPNMTPPTNLVLDNGVLRWAYIPDAEDEPIDGFLIYFNGNVIWTVPASMRAFDLPDEWLNPVCGTSYDFSVGTVIGDYPDSSESPQSNTVTIEPQSGDCNRQVRVTFLTLETHDMPSDGHYEDRSGDIGPIYGQFTVNGQMLSFDTGTLGDGWSTLDLAIGWNENTVYDLIENNEFNRWNFSAYPSLVVEMNQWDNFQYSFGMMDEDTGRCNDGDDPGCDDLVCSGASMNLESESQLAELDVIHEETITSDNGRCSLTVRIEPTGEGATGSSGGSLPLPLIHPDLLTISESAGVAQVDISNQGTAAWPDRDLEVIFLTRDGELLQSRTLESFHLDAGGEDRVIGLLPDGVLDYCVVFDPNNLVPEDGESTGAISIYRQYCLPRPDLTIESIHFNRRTSDLEIGVRNLSDQEVTDRILQFSINLSGVTESILLDNPNFTLAGRSAATLLFPLTAAQRNQMLNINTEDGIAYTLDHKSESQYLETDYDNNTYQIAEARNFSVAWYEGCSDAVVRGLTNHFVMSFVGSIGGEQLFDWDSPEHSVYLSLTDPNHLYACWDGAGSYQEETGDFALMGDETLYLRMSNHVEAGAEDYNLGVWDIVMNPNEPDDYTDRDYPYTCGNPGAQDIGNGTYTAAAHYPGEDDGRPDPGDWGSVFHICRLLER